MTLDTLPTGRAALITGFAAGAGELETKLREIGFAEGDEVEILHVGPFGSASICVRLNRTMVALRRREAATIEVAEIETGLKVAAE
ncbi:MAG: FeoA family protein [Maricaulaceae bacterium]|jgi:ferrous iron transport protein A